MTQPVFALSGKITGIEGDTIVVTMDSRPQQMPGISNQTSKKLTYRVNITPNSAITRGAPMPVVYYLKQNPSPAPLSKLTIKDLKKGDSVTVISKKDLRLLPTASFEAQSINLPPLATSLSGNIVSVSGNIITVKSSTAGQEKQYTVTVNGDTEISRLLPSNDPMKPPKPEKLSLSDLKKDQEIAVYTDIDITNVTAVKALRIEPFAAQPAEILP